jgi:hypothetical protein
MLIGPAARREEPQPRCDMRDPLDLLRNVMPVTDDADA